MRPSRTSSRTGQFLRNQSNTLTRFLHKDTGGHESVIEAGGIQWMTAGSGLIHAEISSDNFKKTGGPLEILQLWVNLPAKFKMIEPRYIGLQANEIPVVDLAPGVVAHAVSGEWGNTAGAVQPLADVALAWLDLAADAPVVVPIAASRNIFFYVVRGSVRVNGTEVFTRELAEFNHEGGELAIEALSDSVLLLGHAEPFGEPVVSAGPFVMNTEGEIRQAYADYQQGKFGTWHG
jgi:redox-sensitive bicupin YhaK (pirin superfamily)